MARVIVEAVKHDCYAELAELDYDNPDLHLGSVAECSCKRQFKKAEDQRDGPYWKLLKPSQYVTDDQPPTPTTTVNAV